VSRKGNRSLAFVIATCGYVGLLPVAPGTFGTLAALPLAYALSWTGSPLIVGFVLALLIVMGIWAAGMVEEMSGRIDPSLVVVDEVVGFLVTVAFLPPLPLLYLAGFLLFRLLDITKPPPARWAEKFPGGLGIMADDLVAGLYGNLILRFGLHWFADAR